MEIDLETLPLTEIIRLQTRLSEVLIRRFERRMALAFSDVVGSAAYFARYGDGAGRGLQQRHFDLLQAVLPDHCGRIVDTAGDGAFTCFPSADGAAEALAELMSKVSEDNAVRQRPNHLMLRVGLHFGSVLSDGEVVTGDAVNLAARVASTAEPGSIRLTHSAFLALPNAQRLRCRALASVELNGIPQPVELFEYRFRDSSRFPDRLRVEATSELLALPSLDVISVGRLRENGGRPANDVVISLPDEKLSRLVSRWHFELRRTDAGFVLKPVTDQVTEVDGQIVPKGAELPIHVGSTVLLGHGVRLTFQSTDAAGAEGAGTGTFVIRRQPTTDGSVP